MTASAPNQLLQYFVQDVPVEMVQQWTSAFSSAAVKDAQIGEQVHRLSKKLQNWCAENSGYVARANLRRLSGDDFLLVITQRQIPYDFDLSEKLTDLDLEIANDSDFELLTLNVMAIPFCSSDDAQAFVDWEQDIRIADFTDA